MIQNKDTLKGYFSTGDKPTQTQFENLIDSLRHAYDKIPLADLELEGYDEQGTRATGITTKLGDFDSSSNGTKIVLTDSASEVKITGNLVMDGEINATGRTITAGLFEGNHSSALGIVGNNTGNANSSYLQFLESDGTTRQGWIGMGSSTNQWVQIYSDAASKGLSLREDGTLFWGPDRVAMLSDVQASDTLQEITDNGSTTTHAISTGGLTINAPTRLRALSVDANGVSDIASFENDHGYIELGHTTNLASIDVGTNQAVRFRQGSFVPLTIPSDGGININKGTINPSQLNTFAVHINQGVGVGVGASDTYGYIQSFSSSPLILNNAGNNVLINPQSGNVGIGVTSPTKKLDVDGEGRTSGLFTANGGMNVNGGPLTIHGGNALVVNSGGSASIGGNTTVTGYLDVSGTGTFEDTLRINAANGGVSSLILGRVDTNVFWTVNHAGGDFRLYNHEASGSDVIIGLDAASTEKNNRLGIGITPTEKLHVNGNGLFTGSVTANGGMNVNGGPLTIHGGNALVVNSGGSASINGNMTLTQSAEAWDNAFNIVGTVPRIKFTDTNTNTSDFWIGANQDSFYILTDRDGDGNQDGTATTPLWLHNDTSLGYIYGDVIATQPWVENHLSSQTLPSLKVEDTIKLGSSTGSNALNSGTLDFLENINNNFGDTYGYGFRLTYNGDGNLFNFQGGDQTNVNTIFSVGRDSGEFNLYRETALNNGFQNVTSHWYKRSIYHATNGILIETNVEVGTDKMIELIIEGNSYFDRNTTGPIISRVQAYNYKHTGTIINAGALSNDVNFTIDAFHYNGKVYFWFEQTNSFQTYSFRTNAGVGSAPAKIVNVTNAVKPTTGVTNNLSITPIKSLTSKNISFEDISNRPIWNWGTNRTDITGLTVGSTFGSIYEGVSTGHVAIGIRGNDTGDSFWIFETENDVNNLDTYTKAIMRVNDTHFLYNGNDVVHTGNMISALQNSFVTVSTNQTITGQKTFTQGLNSSGAVILESVNPTIALKETDTTDQNIDIQVNSGLLKIFGVNDARSTFNEWVTVNASNGLLHAKAGLKVSGQNEMIDNSYTEPFLYKTRTDDSQKIGFTSKVGGSLAIELNDVEHTVFNTDGSLSIAGDASATNFIGNGSQLTNVNATTLNGLSSSKYIYGNSEYGTENTYPTDGGIGANALRRSCFYRDNNEDFGSLGIHVNHPTSPNYALQLATTSYGGLGNIRYRLLNNNTWTEEALIRDTVNFVAGTDYVSINGDETISGVKIFNNNVSISQDLDIDGETRVLASDQDYIVRTYNDSATGDPEQFYIKHNLGNTELGNLRGYLNVTSNIVSGQTITAANFVGDWNGVGVADTFRNNHIKAYRTGAGESVDYNTDFMSNGGVHFSYYGTSNHVNAPHSSYWLVQDIMGQSNAHVQLAFDIDTSTHNNNSFYFRKYNNTNSWSNWTKVLNDQNFQAGTDYVSINETETITGVKTFDAPVFLQDELSSDSAIVTTDEIVASDFRAKSGTENARLAHYGVEFNRIINYLRPVTNNDKFLYIGGYSAGSLDWNVISFFAGESRFFSPVFVEETAKIGGSTTKGELQFFDNSPTAQASLSYDEGATQMTYKNLEGGEHYFTTGMTVNGNVAATDFLGNWNGKTVADFVATNSMNVFTEDNIFNKSITVGGLVDTSVFPSPPNAVPAFKIFYNDITEEVQISAAHGVIGFKDEVKTEMTITQLDNADAKAFVSKEWVENQETGYTGTYTEGGFQYTYTNGRLMSRAFVG